MARRGNVRISGTFNTTDMVADSTDLASSSEHCLALMASPANSLLGRLPDQWLSTWLRTRLCQQDLLTQSPVRVGLDSNHGRHDWLLFFLLRLLLLQWVSWTGLASDMLALRADLAPSKGSIASVACPVYAHPNGLLDARYLLVRLGIHWIDSDRKTLNQLLSAIRINLRPHYLGGLRSISGGGGLDWFRCSNWSWLGGFGDTVGCSVNISS